MWLFEKESVLSYVTLGIDCFESNYTLYVFFINFIKYFDISYID